MRRRVVITGMGVETPFCNTIEGFCNLAIENNNAFKKTERFNADNFLSNLSCSFPPASDSKFLSEYFIEQWMDRAAWYTIQAVHSAIKDCDIDLKSYNPERIGIALGTSHSGLSTTEDLCVSFLEGTLEKQEPRKFTAVLASHIGTVISVLLGVSGPIKVVSSACSSSTGAMGCAYDMIKNDECDIVITGGADTVSLAVMAGFNSLQVLSKKACSPFSKDNGITLGEGAGIIVVEGIDGAIKRKAKIRGEILGYGMSGDAHHATSPDKEGEGIKLSIERALINSEVLAKEIDYISAHGTGTEANDVAESNACLSVFGDSVPISSSKSLFGHTLGASGILETILTISLAEKSLLPQTTNFSKKKEECSDLDYIPNHVRSSKCNTFICNNYGFGGNNASIIIRRNVDKNAEIKEVRVAKEKVYITGVGAINALGSNLEEIQGDKARQEELTSTHKRIKKVVLDKSLKRDFGRSPPSVKYALIATREALSTSSLLSVSDNKDTSLIMGSILSIQHSTEKFMESVFVGQSPELASAYHFPKTTINAIGGQLAISYGFKGYSTTFCSACSSVGYGLALIQNKYTKKSVICSSDEISDTLLKFLDLSKVARKNKTRAFDGISGVNLGEGSSTLVLESAQSLKSRKTKPMAEFVNYSESKDPCFSGLDKKGSALSRVINKVLKESELKADDISVVICPGNGVGHYPKTELNILNKIFNTRYSIIASFLQDTGFGISSFYTYSIAVAVQLLQGKRPKITTLNNQNIPDNNNYILVLGTDLTGVSSASIIGKIK